MKDVSGNISYNGRDYKLVFNLNVMERIQEEYGTLDKWGELTDGSTGEPNAKAIKFGFTEMINEGIEMENEQNGTDIKPFTEKQVGRIITEIGLANVVDTVNTTVINSTKDDGKNV